eukprot:12895768-Prorocentrum_lima.AAC.1
MTWTNGIDPDDADDVDDPDDADNTDDVDDADDTDEAHRAEHPVLGLGRRTTDGQREDVNAGR